MSRLSPTAILRLLALATRRREPALISEVHKFAPERAVGLLVVTWKIRSHQEPHLFIGLFSFAGSPRELCFNAS
jgi:hypothetical protein